LRTEFESIAATTLLSMAATTRANDEAVRALTTDAGAELREEADVEAQDRELRKRLEVRERRAAIPRGSFLTAEAAARAYDGWAATTPGLASCAREGCDQRVPSARAMYCSTICRQAVHRATKRQPRAAAAGFAPAGNASRRSSYADQTAADARTQVVAVARQDARQEPTLAATAADARQETELKALCEARGVQHPPSGNNVNVVALNLPAGYEGGGASASRQRAALPTRPGARVHSLPQQRDDGNDDEPELLVASDWQLTDSDRPHTDDDGDGVASSERVGRDSAQGKAPAADIARGSKADCAQYIGVSFQARSLAHPFQASVYFNSKTYHICCCPTAEAAARAYDAVACMIPGRKLNFPTTIPAAATSSRQQQGASAPVSPTESDILAAIAAAREAQPEPWRGAVKYIGVYFQNRSARNPYQARARIDGKEKHLGLYATAEAAARAYDVVARTISGRKLNFPTGDSSAAAAAGDSHTAVRSLPAPSTGQPSHPSHVAHGDDDGSAAAPAASACVRKRKQPSSSSLSGAGSVPHGPAQ
jgi:hypothetical protein